jgi:pimeloyl-ACP methyl ester carboxylesterase
VPESPVAETACFAPEAPTEAPREGLDTVPSEAAAIAPEPQMVDLSVAGFPDAVLSLPNGATGLRPVLVVLHGMRGRPDANCNAWRAITGARAFVLCPRGQYDPRGSSPSDKRYTHRGGEYLRRHIAAALDALAERFPSYADIGRPALAGFSLGATEAALLAQSAPDRFPRVAILEGGVDVWAESTIGAFAAHGGRRVLFGCGSAWCTPPAAMARAHIERGGVAARLVTADVGHTYGPPMQDAIKEQLDWFFEGDPRWTLASGSGL